MDIIEEKEGQTERLIDAFISAGDAECADAAVSLAAAFGEDEALIGEGRDDALLSSFKRNLALLVQKTWVESTDVALKDSVLYRLEKFRSTDAVWRQSYEPFLSLIRDGIYLMFGSVSREDDFAEYARRIDPQFGAFYYFIDKLPDNPAWSEAKYHYAIDCGMSFLANY